jgi:glycosyltransferase involved in cell wall biosynthesis
VNESTVSSVPRQRDPIAPADAGRSRIAPLRAQALGQVDGAMPRGPAGDTPGVLDVLHVGKFYPPVPGGMEQVVESLCHATGEGIACRVLAFNTGRSTVREQVAGISVTRVGTIGMAGSVPIAPALVSELRRTRADVMILHEPNPWALLSWAIARPRTPLAVWFHSEVVRPRLQYSLFYHPLFRTVYQHARRIVVSSPQLAEHAASLAPYRDRITVIPFGIEVSRWDATPGVAGRAAEIRGAAAGRPLILFAGRMVPYKGVDVLLRALVGIDAAAVLVGGGPSRDAWMTLARELGLADRVRFAGEVPHAELAALYHACDLFVLPSVTRAEAFGYVQLEAMTCGKPVVSTRLASGVPWVNQDGETGLTVPPGQDDALREAIRTLVRDAPLRLRLGAAGRARVLSEFTIDRMRVATSRLYREVAAG